MNWRNALLIAAAVVVAAVALGIWLVVKGLETV
jgi:hypothetical protein